MTKGAFEIRIQEICDIIAELPPEMQGQLLNMVEETRRRFASEFDSSQAARDALDDLRLRCKYVLFDAEARQREQHMDPDQKGDGPPL